MERISHWLGDDVCLKIKRLSVVSCPQLGGYIMIKFDVNMNVSKEDAQKMFFWEMICLGYDPSKVLEFGLSNHLSEEYLEAELVNCSVCGKVESLCIDCEFEVYIWSWIEFFIRLKKTINSSLKEDQNND